MPETPNFDTKFQFWGKMVSGPKEDPIQFCMISQKEKATSLFNKIIHSEHKKIEIRLVGKLQQSSEQNFHALYYKVRPIQEHAPSWWPKNAHISFAYRYDVPFSKIEMETIARTITVYTGTLTELRVMNCSEHFSKWKLLLQH